MLDLHIEIERMLDFHFSKFFISLLLQKPEIEPVLDFLICFVFSLFIEMERMLDFLNLFLSPSIYFLKFLSPFFYTFRNRANARFLIMSLFSLIIEIEPMLDFIVF